MPTIKSEPQNKGLHMVTPYDGFEAGYQTRSLFFSDKETI